MALSCKRTVWLGVVCSLILGGCTTTPPIEYEILHVEGITWAANVTTSYALYGSTTESEDRLEVFLPVSEGDLLYLVNNQDLEMYYRYSAADGNHLVVSYDTLKPHLAFVNGTLAQIEITDETLSGIRAGELPASGSGHSLTLIISDSLTDDMIRVLAGFEPFFRGAGIALENRTGTSQFRELVSIFRPGWLSTESIPLDPEAVQGIFLEDLELLWTAGDQLAISNSIQYCKNLESLIIADWDPGTGELISLTSLKNLKSLTLGECGIGDLSNLEIPEQLQQLYIVGCDTLTGIKEIVSMRDLESLGLSGNEVASLNPVMELTKLKRMAFPMNTSQEDFSSIVAHNQFLEIVELIECSKVNNLSVLQEAENLDILILETDTIWPDHLESLDQLEMVILGSALFENTPERIAELRTQLPDALIVPGGGLCMGSGWLLLLWPLILVSRILFKKR